MHELTLLFSFEREGGLVSSCDFRSNYWCNIGIAFCSKCLNTVDLNFSAMDATTMDLTLFVIRINSWI